MCLEREVCGSNLGTDKLDTVLPTAHRRFNISSKEAAVLTGRNDTKMGPANTLHKAQYSEYNETFNF